MNATPRVMAAVMKLIKPNGGRLIQEAHPFFIYPASTAAAPISARFLTKRLANTAGAYVPLLGLFFGWPFAAKYFITKTGGP